ncbi:unnamed protein product [Lepidochelys olivacea]
MGGRKFSSYSSLSASRLSVEDVTLPPTFLPDHASLITKAFVKTPSASQALPVKISRPVTLQRAFTAPPYTKAVPFTSAPTAPKEAKMNGREYRGLSAIGNSVQAMSLIPFINDSFEEGEVMSSEPEEGPYEPHSSSKSLMEVKGRSSTKVTRVSSDFIEEGKLVSSEPEETPGETDSSRRFLIEDLPYLCKYFMKQLRLKRYTSRSGSRKLPHLVEEKPDDTIPLHPSISALIKNIWQAPDAQFILPTHLAKLYKLPAEKGKLWASAPRVDSVIASLFTKSSCPVEGETVLTDPLERKVDEALKSAYEFATIQLSVSIYSLYAARSLVEWLRKLLPHSKRPVSRSSRKVCTLCDLASCYLHDAAQDSLHLAAHNIATLTVARRALWLCPLTGGELSARLKLVGLPYDGGHLFGETLDQALKDLSKSTVIPGDRKKPQASNSSRAANRPNKGVRYPLSSYRPGRYRYRYPVNQSVHFPGYRGRGRTNKYQPHQEF